MKRSMLKRECPACGGFNIMDPNKDIMVGGVEFMRFDYKDCGTVGPEYVFGVVEVFK